MACLWWALLLLCLPLKWLLACAAAAATHEMGHAVAVFLTGGNIRSVRIGMAGAIIKGDCSTYGREIVCSLAGPLCSLHCLIWLRVFPWFAFCGLIQGIYNLLPLYPLDGGRALLGILRKVCSRDPYPIFLWIQIIIFGILAAVCIFACFRFRLGISALFPLLPALFGKTPCKDENLRLQ